MKTLTLLLAGTFLAVLCHAKNVEDSIAPHFEINGAPAGVDALPLKSTSTRVCIAGVIAEVELTQTYANTGSAPIEAIYVFPGSTRAAVHGLEVRIGDRVITATIQERDQAQRTYDQAKAEKKTATLLKQHRPNVFEMAVANIVAGAEVQVRLHYSEKLVPTDHEYAFVLPGVVGPRYTKEGNGATWQTNPYLGEGKPGHAKFEFAMQLDAGLPLQSLTSPSHQLDIKFTSKSTAALTLKPTTEGDDPSNRDLIVRYRLADSAINTGLLLHKGQDDNFFLLNVQPPARVTMKEVPARDYLFIVDVSGSMHGFPLDTAKSLMRELFGSLREKDKFNLLLFSGGSAVLSESPLPANSNNIGYAMRMMDNEQGGGGTELLPALRRALTMPGDDDRARNIVVITDGYVDIEREAFDLVRNNLNQASLFVMGIGSSVNRHLLEGLANVGHGEAFVVTQPGEIKDTTRRFIDYVSSPVLTDIHVRAEGFDISELQPASIPTLFADRPLEIIGKWQGAAQGRIIVTGRTATGPYETSFNVSDVASNSHTHPALRPLWARERARILGDYASIGDTISRDELTKVGLKYSLLTERTSFVAVDQQPQVFATNATTVQQPLPLPQGVSNQAIGAAPAAGAVPEPDMALLAIFGLAVLAMHRRRPAQPLPHA